MNLNKNVTLHQGCCLEILKTLPSNSFDLVLTSPPYNMRTRVRNGKYTTREKSEHFSKKYSDFGDDLSINNYYTFHKEVIEEMLRVSNVVFLNIQIVTGSKEAWFKLIGHYSIYIKDIIIWDKGHGQPAMHEAVLNRGYELIIILENPAKLGRALSTSTFKRGEMQDVWRLGRGGKGNVNGHGAVFPESLVEQVLLNWKSDRILDPFAGTGTTLRVANRLNKNVTGVELSQSYCDFIVNSFKETS